MLKRTMSATAKSASVIEVYVDKEFTTIIHKYFAIYKDKKFLYTVKPVSMSESHSSFIYTLLMKDMHYEAGREYEIGTENNFFIPIDISFLAFTKEFESKFRYDGPLGAIYSKERTTFRVYSPLASKIVLLLQREGSEKEEAFVMDHNYDNGIHEITVEGDLDKASYVYSVHMFGSVKETVDPYSFSLNTNSRKSYVIDSEKVEAIPLHEEELPVLENKTEAIIYECNVRDMTSLSDVPNKGTYSALTQEGYKDKRSMPVGLDYLASLGITHAQLQPVLDFQTIDDSNPFRSYNWGYDPLHFFSPEGSYALSPEDPYSRVLELRKMVAKFHEKGMRVVLDVVYNHVYNESIHPFSILCPKYYFRYNGDGNLSNGSGCGNDIESRNYMVRKLILDSLKHCIHFFGVDGFRFDLMGILDIDTITQGYEECSKLKSDILFYGEGWDLWTALPGDKKASYYNANAMPFASFFNDRFRDVAKGKSSETELSVSGYLLGDTNYRDGFKHVLLGSSVALSFAPMFNSHEQSINFVECHDNHTLFDKIARACPQDNEKQVDARIKLCIAATLLACGIPFFHEGEEIGHSKRGEGNTYNKGDSYNGFDYDLLDKKKDLYQYFVDAIAMKKKFIQTCGEDYVDLTNHMSFDNLPNGALKVNYDLKTCAIYVIFNPSKESFMYEFDDYVNLIFNDTGNVLDNNFYTHLSIINALSLSIFYRKKNSSALADQILEKRGQ